MEIKDFAIIFVLILTVSAGTFNVVLTCSPCSSSCSSYSSCYKITSDSYNELVCADCQGSVNLTMKVSKCSSDYSGAACSSGLCLSSATTQACFSSFPTASLCSTSQTISASCSACTQTPSCSTNCYKISSSVGTNEFCMDCSNLPTTTATVFACPNGKDPSGNSCACCYTANSAGGAIQQCTANNPLFTSAQFSTYAKEKTYGTSERYFWSFAFVAMMSVAVIFMF